MDIELTETNQLKDRVNALEALCVDLLALQYGSHAQARVKFDDYQIKFTQEAVEKREAEAREKRLRENLMAANAEFKDTANAQYWSLVFKTPKAQEQTLKKLWEQATEGLELPLDAKRPAYSVITPTEEKLMQRKQELESVINRINPTYLNDTITHCENSLINATKALERESQRLIAQINKDDKLTSSEREQKAKDTQTLYESKIRQVHAENNRQIQSAKVELNRLQQAKEELQQLKALLAKLLTQ